MSTKCVRCGRPMPDQAYACTRCAHRARGQLIGDPTDERIIAIADATPAARDIAQGQSRNGTSSSSGKPGSRLPFDTANTQKLNRVEYVLIEKWVKPIARERGYAGVIYDAAKRGNDPIVIAATWLAGQVEWIRHRKNAADFLAAIDECTRVVRGIARGPGEQKFLGPCGAEVTWDADGNEMPRDPCPGDVFAHAGAQDGACRACGARWSTAKREAWLDGEVREHAFEARDIAEAHRLNVKTIRTWANRGALRTYWRTSADLVVEWNDPPIDDALKGEERAAREAAIADELAARGPRLHYVGDVLDLAAADAARRATEQAKRARRAAVKAEVDAKRRILDEVVEDATGLDMSVDLDRRTRPRDEVTEPYLGDVLVRLLALPYADRPRLPRGMAATRQLTCRDDGRA